MGVQEPFKRVNDLCKLLRFVNKYAILRTPVLKPWNFLSIIKMFSTKTLSRTTRNTIFRPNVTAASSGNSSSFWQRRNNVILSTWKYCAASKYFFSLTIFTASASLFSTQSFPSPFECDQGISKINNNYRNTYRTASE